MRLRAFTLTESLWALLLASLSFTIIFFVVNYFFSAQRETIKTVQDTGTCLRLLKLLRRDSQLACNFLRTGEKSLEMIFESWGDEGNIPPVIYEEVEGNLVRRQAEITDTIWSVDIKLEFITALPESFMGRKEISCLRVSFVCVNDTNRLLLKPGRRIPAGSQ